MEYEPESFYSKDTHRRFQLVIEAARAGNLTKLQHLIVDASAGGNEDFVNTVDCGFTALNMAIREKQQAIVTYLLSLNNINLGIKTGQRDTALSVAILYENDDVINALVKDTRVNLYCTEGGRFHNTAVHFAVKKESRDVVELLLDHMQDRTSDVAVQNLYEASYYACAEGNVHIARILLERRCFVPEKGMSMGRLVREACQHNQHCVLRYLLDNFSRWEPAFDLSSAEGQQYLIGEQLYQGCGLGNITCVQVIAQHLTAAALSEQQILLLFKRVLLALGKGYYKIAKLLLDKLEQLRAGFIDLVALEDLVQALQTRGSGVQRKLYGLIAASSVLSYDACVRELCDHSVNDDEVLQYKLYHCMEHGLTAYHEQLLRKHNSNETLRLYRRVYKGVTFLNLSRKHRAIADACDAVLGHFLTDDEKREQHKIAAFYAEVDFVASELKNISANDMQLYPGKVNVTQQVLDTIARNDARQEKAEIKAKLLQLFEALSVRVANQNRLFSFAVELRGSASEDCQATLPGEFDVLLVLTGLEQYVFIEYLKLFYSCYTCCVRIQQRWLDDAATAAWMQQYVQQGNYLNAAAFLKDFFRSLTHQLKLLVESDHVDDRIVLEDVFFENKNVPCLYFMWRGREYLDLPIKIDLVPTVQFRSYRHRFDEKQLLVTNDNNNSCCRAVVIYKNGLAALDAHTLVSCRFLVTFPDAELACIARLPQSARAGFKLAKAMRCARAFPKHVIDVLIQTEFSVEDLLPTYMLKTALFYCYDDVSDICADFAPLRWACMIYAYLEERLRRHGAMASYFLTEQVEDVDKVFECRHELDVLPAYERRCCTKRKHLLLAVTWVRESLREYATGLGIDTGKVSELW